MSYCRKEGKDVIIFATAEDHKEPSKVTLPEPEPAPGLILPNGEINWNCPCLGGMATGPCGVEFREAFSCFHNSDVEPKGSDCYDAFKEMHLCMAEFPQLYNKYDDDEKDLMLDQDRSTDSPEKTQTESREVPFPESTKKTSESPKKTLVESMKKAEPESPKKARPEIPKKTEPAPDPPQKASLRSDSVKPAENAS